MKSTISKDQNQELRQILTRMKVSKETIETLLSSKYAANVYKAYKYKKKILTDNKWIIHFGANWAKPPATNNPEIPAATLSTPVHVATNNHINNDADITVQLTDSDETEDDIGSIYNADTLPNHLASPAEATPLIEAQTPEQAAREIASAHPIGEDLASRTLQTIVSFIRKPKAEETPSRPRMRKIAIEIDEDILAKLKQLSDAENIPISALIRLAVRKYVS